MHISSDYPFQSRAASYGDGCFTTAAIESGQIELLSLHMKRLNDACQQLYIPVSTTQWATLEQYVIAEVKKVKKGVLKIIVSAGDGGRGYSRTPDGKPVAYVQVMDSQPDYSRWRQNGITLEVAKIKVAKQSALTHIKHLNRLEQTLIKSTAVGCDDVLVLDSDGMIVEASAANVFWCAQNRWFTPELCNSGVAGVMRNHILRCFEGEKLNISQVRANLNVLSTATDMLICNSLMKLVPVNALNINSKQTLQFPNQNIQTITSILSNSITF